MQTVLIGFGVPQFVMAVTFDYAALVLFKVSLFIKNGCQTIYSAEILHCFYTLGSKYRKLGLVLHVADNTLISPMEFVCRLDIATLHCIKEYLSPGA